jgi:hypothetical protein
MLLTAPAPSSRMVALRGGRQHTRPARQAAPWQVGILRACRCAAMAPACSFDPVRLCFVRYFFRFDMWSGLQPVVIHG